MIKIETEDMEEKRKIEEIIRDILMPMSLRDFGRFVEAIQRRTGCNVVLKRFDWDSFGIAVRKKLEEKKKK